ncbi:hypothetical protein V6N13_015673 [Hibiscus sabdariffa]|uniref:Pentatricopeptide repeat-containing protein n=1 Tax=Hibiscus sabdariffa TaxID=183260 RepID=A0ABR2CWD4_9ROSI
MHSGYFPSHRIQRILARRSKFVGLFQFRTCFYCTKVGFVAKRLLSEPKSRFYGYPFVYIRFNAYLSYSSGRNFNPGSRSSSGSSVRIVERDDFDGGNVEYGKFREMGVKVSGELSSSGDNNGGCQKNQSMNFGGFDEFEEEEGENCCDDKDDDDFVALNSYNVQSVRTDDVWKIELEEDEFRHPLVREICRLIQLRSSWNPKLESDMRHLLRSLKPRQVCAVLLSQDDERVALQFFYWADRQWRYRHNAIVYYAMLEILSKTKLCQGARRVLRLMARRGIQCRPEAFGYLMVSYSRAGNLRNALKVLTLVQKAGVELNLALCNTAIHVLVMSNRLEKALRFFERMQIVGIIPNVVTYNCLIKGYCNLNQVENALQLIADMSSKNCSPDKVSYYTIMSFFCKEKQVKEVRDLMEKMVKESNLFLDMVTYNTLIHMLSKNGHADEALEFLQEAEASGFRIDKVGHSAIVHSYCKQGKIEEAKSIVNEMLSKGCNPDVVTYTAVVDGFCRVGKVDQAKKMLQHMYKHDCKPNTVSYTALLTGLCRSGNSLQAREMMNGSEEEFWTPNAITYSAVMHGLRKEGKLSEACDVAKKMISMGFFPNPVEINLIIESLCREEKMDEAKRFLEECLNKGCAANVVNFTTLIHGYCRKGDLESALSLLDDMYLSNKHPDAVTYTAIIDALGKKGRIEEATETMKMLKKGLLPTPVTYRTVIHRYCQMESVEDLLKLLEKMLSRQKCKTVYNQVIEKLCSFGNLQEADKLLSRILKTASRNDANTCNMLMESYLSKEMPLSAYKVACRMFNRNLIPDLKLSEKVSKRLMLEGKSAEADNLMLRFVERGRLSPQGE